MNKKNGFTLVELLVCISIIAVLSSIVFAVTHRVKQRMASTKEIHAARKLMVAYQLYAADHNGSLLEGYRKDPNTVGMDGNPVTFPMNARYPWRLMPYLGNPREELTVNGNEKAWDAKENLDYKISVMPNFGINAVLVGGHYGSGSPLPPTQRMISSFGKFFVSNAGEVDSPSNLIVFASARKDEESPGYFEVRPPRLTGPVWESKAYDPKQPGPSHGFVDFRHDGKAVIATFDGGAKLATEDELRDMRMWSNQASRAGDANFTISRQ
jgi:prepilin-type N-terminal cleavage/methylation domain-containing protein